MSLWKILFLIRNYNHLFHVCITLIACSHMIDWYTYFLLIHWHLLETRFLWQDNACFCSLWTWPFLELHTFSRSYSAVHVLLYMNPFPYHADYTSHLVPFADGKIIAFLRSWKCNFFKKASSISLNEEISWKLNLPEI